MHGHACILYAIFTVQLGVVLSHMSKVKELLVSQLGAACVKIIHFLEQQMRQNA